MTSSKKKMAEKPDGRSWVDSCDAKSAGSFVKPASLWLNAPRRGWLYVSSILFLGWLCFLGVIAYLVNFQ